MLVFLAAPPGRRPNVAAAAAVELVHMATLVHDDLIDGAAFRRGRVSAWQSFGPEAARAAGDYLFARAFAELAATGDAHAVSTLAGAALCLARGEALQRSQTHDPDTTIDAYLERCALEAIRIGQCSVILRTVMRDIEIDDGRARYHVERGVTLATMLALTNTTSLPGLDDYDPDRWDGRRLRAEADLPTREAVTTFGFGPHRCPAQRFSLSAITRVIRGLAARYDVKAEFTTVRPIPEQIGGVARAADPCPIAYAAR